MKPGQINNSKGGWNDYPTNPRPAPPKPQKPRQEDIDRWEPAGTHIPYRNLIEKIEKEAKADTYRAGYYDFRPTAKEQLKKIIKLIEDFYGKKDNSYYNLYPTIEEGPHNN
jgi:hypothetical protein